MSLELPRPTLLVESVTPVRDARRFARDTERLLDNADFVDPAQAGSRGSTERVVASRQAAGVPHLPSGGGDANACYFSIQAENLRDFASCKFAVDILRLYVGYATRKSWDAQVLGKRLSKVSGFDQDGIEHGLLVVDAHRAFGRLQYESGFHRMGRAAVYVEVWPRLDDLEFGDCAIEVSEYRSSGVRRHHGVRMKHVPTGIEVEMEEHVSFEENRLAALAVVRAHMCRQRHGPPEQSPIRSFNPDSGVVSISRDARLASGHFEAAIGDMFDGNLDGFLDGLIGAYQAERLASEKRSQQEVGPAGTDAGRA